MPRQIADDDEIPRRRRSAKAVAIDADEERGLAMRLLLHNPKDTIAGFLAAAAVIAIVTNALFLQAGRHPSPMFGSIVTLAPPQSSSVPSPLPRPRPADAAAQAEPRPAETRTVETKPIETRVPDPLTTLVAKTAAPPAQPSSVARPPAPISNLSPAGRRIAAVQRALTEYGYGQLKPTGTIGADTQNAILKFERDRKLPPTGQMSDRVVRELSNMIGHPID